jgi:hypothetical protein
MVMNPSGLLIHEILPGEKQFIAQNSEKPIKAVIRHLPPDTPAEDISNSLENLGFNVISMR